MVLGDTFGRHAKDEFPTRPRVTLFNAVASTVIPNRGATTDISKPEDEWRAFGWRTKEYNPICEGVHGPDIGSPISMAQPTCKREESLQQLIKLLPVYERAESYSKDDE